MVVSENQENQGNSRKFMENHGKSRILIGHPYHGNGGKWEPCNWGDFTPVNSSLGAQGWRFMHSAVCGSEASPTAFHESIIQIHPKRHEMPISCLDNKYFQAIMERNVLQWQIHHRTCVLPLPGLKMNAKWAKIPTSCT